MQIEYVDQGCTGEKAAAAAAEHDIALQVVRLEQTKRGFALLPKRSPVMAARTFSADWRTKRDG